MRLKAAKKKFAQSRCTILHALHKLRKKRARKASVVLVSGAPNENIVQNHLNIELLNVF